MYRLFRTGFSSDSFFFASPNPTCSNRWNQTRRPKQTHVPDSSCDTLQYSPKPSSWNVIWLKELCFLIKKDTFSRMTTLPINDVCIVPVVEIIKSHNGFLLLLNQKISKQITTFELQIFKFEELAPWHIVGLNLIRNPDSYLKFTQRLL